MKRHPMHPYINAARQQMRHQQMSQQHMHEPEQDNAAPMQPDPAYEEPRDQVEIGGTSQECQKTAESAPGEALEKEKQALEDERLRMAAEMENFKKRLTREHQEQMRYASEKVLGDLLPALDNLDLALQYGSEHEACRHLMQGIEMTRKQLLEAVAKSGLVSVGEKGEPFNPEIHEAIGMEGAPDVEKGAVSRVLQRGYKLNDRLMRPAKVLVNS